MSVIAINSAARDRAWALLTSLDGTVIEQREMPGGELDRRLPAILAELGAGEATAVVVLTGPGSYSGVRAGMAAALGIATARSLALHGVGNLTAIAMAAEPADGGQLTAVADAGRGGVYAARFAVGQSEVEQVSAILRVGAGEVDWGGRLVATTRIDGLITEQVDPVRVLAAAVPQALRLPPLDPVGLSATHAG